MQDSVETVDVIVPTCGDIDVWKPLAERAQQSAFNQVVKANRVIWSHKATVSEARNFGASLSTGDWLIFLDADDELDPRYIEHMIAGSGDIRQPSTLGVVNGVEDDFPVLIEQKSLIIGNYLIIGSMVRRKLFLSVGGFRDFPILEDWDLFIRLALAGAKIGKCPDAIYRVHVLPDSRNKQGDSIHGSVYSQIQREHEAAWFAKFHRDESSLYVV